MFMTSVCLRTLPGPGCCISPADDTCRSCHHPLHHCRSLHLQSVRRQRLLQLLFRYRQPGVKGKGSAELLQCWHTQSRGCLVISCILHWVVCEQSPGKEGRKRLVLFFPHPVNHDGHVRANSGKKSPSFYFYIQSTMTVISEQILAKSYNQVNHDGHIRVNSGKE